MASADVRKELECSICLNIYTDPVILRCGHNFCRVCIDCVLDTPGTSAVYSCPQCRAESVERPVLIRNITLCNILGSYPCTQPAQEENGIFCTYCVDFPAPAVKSCLHCEASLCDKHLRVHSKAPEHVITDPTTSMEDRKCSIHKKLLEYYCTEDSTCICVSCRLDGEHQRHQVEMLDEASEKKKKRLRNVLQDLITKREETERRVQSLQEHKMKVHRRAAGESESISSLFRDLRRELEDLEKRVLREITRQEENISLYMSNLIQELETKKEDLSRKIDDIEELCNMTDPLTVLQGSDIGDAEDEDNEDKGRHDDKPICGGDHLDVGFIRQTLHTLSHIMRDVKIDVYNSPKLADILLDVNTAYNKLHISDDGKTVTSGIYQKRTETPERFQDRCNVISRCSFSSGWYYWDVECSEGSSWRIGMCYPSIERRGNQSWIGNNDRSWCLQRIDSVYEVIHDRTVIQLFHTCSSNRFRLSLDYKGGQLTFYELCDPIRHLHTFTTTFTEPLHAAIGMYWRMGKIGYVKDWVRILDTKCDF